MALSDYVISSSYYVSITLDLVLKGRDGDLSYLIHNYRLNYEQRLLKRSPGSGYLSSSLMAWFDYDISKFA